MPTIIRTHDNRNQPIIPGNTGVLPLTFFNLIRLNKQETFTQCLPGFETVCVVLAGNCDVQVNGETFRDIGKRPDIWSGHADSVYVTTGTTVRIRANQDGSEIAVAGGKCDHEWAPFRIHPEDVEAVDVGSVETHSHRRIAHILGQNVAGRVGNLLVSELYADEGCWSGYPPHKHDQEQGTNETAFEEVYYYRFRPETGFGAQLVFQPDDTSQCFLTRNGDTVLIDKGYHPTVTSPGHEAYIFAILVGKHQRSLIQNFKEEHRHLMNTFPGIKTMREKFK